MLRRMLWFMLVAGCYGATATAQQYIYKWNDDQGQAKYSELPPPTGVPYETVRKRTGSTPGAESATRDLTKEQEELARQVAEQKKKEEEQAEQAQKQVEDVRAKNCEVAKKNVQVLQGDSPVVKTDAKGNRVALDAPQREAELKKAQKDQDYFCNP